MSRTVEDLVTEYWGACISRAGNNDWCIVHESRWSDKTEQSCDDFLHIADFVEYIRRADGGGS